MQNNVIIKWGIGKYDKEVKKNKELILSTSWKITKPIRFFKIIFYKMLRREK